jgi:hypothetical protein
LIWIKNARDRRGARDCASGENDVFYDFLRTYRFPANASQTEAAMRKWWDIRNKGNRELFGWLGGGLVVVIGGLWAAYTYFHPKPEGGAVKVEASCGSFAMNGNITGSTVTTGGGAVSCPPKKAEP